MGEGINLTYLTLSPQEHYELPEALVSSDFPRTPFPSASHHSTHHGAYLALIKSAGERGREKRLFFFWLLLQSQIVLHILGVHPPPSMYIKTLSSAFTVGMEASLDAVYKISE